jgi:hypothetical protein
MRGDFSRRTFRPDRHYSAVLLQQGRVVLDADWNEQAEIQLRLVRRMMRDLVGPHGGPAGELGFMIESQLGDDGKLRLRVRNGFQPANGDVQHLERGRYYVDGIDVEHVEAQDDPLELETGLLPAALREQVVLVYLEVWERHVTYVEENVPFQRRSMREVALGGPDTASRSEVRWAVRTSLQPRNPRTSPVLTNGGPVAGSPDREALLAEALGRLLPAKGRLAASLTTQDIGEGDPCRDTAQPRYRGPENRLYRVEIHEVENADRGPTFKWSRENGSVTYPLALASEQKRLTGTELTVEVVGLGRDDRYRLRRGDIVELVTKPLDEAGDAGHLLEVKDVEDDARTVTLQSFDEAVIDVPVARDDDPDGGWALLRRWDQSHEPKRNNGASAKTEAGAIEIDGGDEFVLEDGIVVRFQRPAALTEALAPYEFRVGDYWLIPARTIPGDIEWPREKASGGGVLELPHGVERHVAPLAVVDRDEQEQVIVRDLRKRFSPLATGV